MSPDAEVIEGEYTEQRGLAVIPPTGTRALALLSDEEFETNLRAIAKGQQRIARMQRELLVKGVDYANVPGVEKPSLGKPGAEKLCLAYGLAARVEVQLVQGDGVSRPLFTYNADCFLHLGSFDGPVVGDGHGTCNSWEAKYRYRNADRTCPKCDKATIIKGRAEYGGGWLCFAKKGGCGSKFTEKDPAIIGQQTGQVENPDPSDLANTIMKMAEKRAHVDATLRTTAASGIFTQDMEDNVGTADEPPAAEAPKAPKPVARSTEPPILSDRELAELHASSAAPPPAEGAPGEPLPPVPQDAPDLVPAAQAVFRDEVKCGWRLLQGKTITHCGQPAGHSSTGDGHDFEALALAKGGRVMHPGEQP